MIKGQLRAAVIVALVFVVALTGMYVPVSLGHSLAAGGNGVTAYADTTTGGAVTAPVDISAAQVAPIKDRSYSGKKITPSPKVTLGGKTLKKGRDYTLSYKKNKNPGVATLTIKGKSPGYNKSVKVTFNIVVNAPKDFKLKVTSDSVDASWKKAPGKITGYKVVYASNSKFTKSKRTKTIESSKTKGYSIDRPYRKSTFYVKARAYVAIGKKIYYSAYTTVKTKKTPTAGWFKKISKSIGKDTKWIEADLSKQVVYLHKGNETVKTYAASSGKPGTPTVRGTFKVYKKIKEHDMIGIDEKTGEEIYRQPNVKWATYFVKAYAFHGSYWNPEVNKPVDEKRSPRSHGCVNMREVDAKYLYNWAPIGTLVSVHK